MRNNRSAIKSLASTQISANPQSAEQISARSPGGAALTLGFILGGLMIVRARPCLAFPFGRSVSARACEKMARGFDNQHAASS
jgi:hypothetical protein